MTYPTFDAEKATEQIREYADKAAGTGRQLGQIALDTYEQAVNSFIEFENKAAEAAPIDWVKTAIGAHATLVNDVSGAYVKAARSALEN